MLLAALRRALVPLPGLPLALLRQVREVGLVVRKHRGSLRVILRGRGDLTLRRLQLARVRVDVLLSRIDLLTLSIRRLVEGVRGRLLLLLHLRLLRVPILVKILEQVQDAAGVEGVVLVRDLRHGLQERRRAALRGSGHAHGLGQGQRLLHLVLDLHEGLRAADVRDSVRTPCVAEAVSAWASSYVSRSFSRSSVARSRLASIDDCFAWRAAMSAESWAAFAFFCVSVASSAAFFVSPASMLLTLSLLVFLQKHANLS